MSNLTDKCSVNFILPQGALVSGAVTWTLGLAQCMKQANMPVSVLSHTCREADNILPVQDADFVTNIPHCAYHVDSLEDVVRQIPAYTEQLPSVFIPNWSTGSYALTALLSMTNPRQVRVLGVVHCDEEYYYDMISYYEPIISRFIAVSNEIASNLKPHIPPERHGDIVVRPCSVNTPDTLSRDYSSPDQPINILYTGRISRIQKRVDLLVELARKLVRQKVDFKLSIVGSGAYQSELLNIIASQERTVRERICMHPAVSVTEIPEMYSKADIFVLTSEYEGTSVSLLEAMGHGCVPVTTAVSGTAALISNDYNGYTVPVGDMAGMADCIRSLAQNRKELKRLGHSAHKKVQSKYSHNSYLAWLKPLLDSLRQEPAGIWPADKPLLMPGTASSPLCRPDGSENIAQLGAHELMTNLLARLTSAGLEKVLIYGAGEHSRKVLPAIRSSNARILGFIDDDRSRQGANFEEWPIIMGDKISELDAEAIVISSDTIEQQLFNKAQEAVIGKDIQVFTLYNTGTQPVSDSRNYKES